MYTCLSDVCAHSLREMTGDSGQLCPHSTIYSPGIWEQEANVLNLCVPVYNLNHICLTDCWQEQYEVRLYTLYR